MNGVDFLIVETQQEGRWETTLEELQIMRSEGYQITEPHIEDGVAIYTAIHPSEEDWFAFEAEEDWTF